MARLGDRGPTRRASPITESQHLPDSLIVGDCAGAARAIAETLARLAKIESEVRALNARLPPGTVDVQIEAFKRGF
jgi:hypothetical protein